MLSDRQKSLFLQERLFLHLFEIFGQHPSYEIIDYLTGNQGWELSLPEVFLQIDCFPEGYAIIRDWSETERYRIVITKKEIQFSRKDWKECVIKNSPSVIRYRPDAGWHFLYRWLKRLSNVD